MSSNLTSSEKMKQLTVFLCVFVGAVTSMEEVLSEFLPVDETAFNDLAKNVCNLISPDPIDCKVNFLNQERATKDPGLKASICQFNRSIFMQVPEAYADNHQLLVVVPGNRSTNMLDFYLKSPQDTELERFETDGDDLTVWTNTLAPNGSLGIWRMGAHVPNFTEVHAEKKITNIYNIYLRNMKVKSGSSFQRPFEAEFTWDPFNDTEVCFSAIHTCANKDLEYTTIKSSNNISVVFSDLAISDNCTLLVKGIYGWSVMKYATPSCINETECEPEIPANITLYATKSTIGSEWDVEVAWDSPEYQPRLFNVTILSDSVYYNTIVSGNATSAIVTNVVGSGFYKVQVAAVGTFVSAVSTKDGQFPPEEPASSIVVIVVSVWALVLLVAVSGCVVCLRVRTQRRRERERRRSLYFEGIIEKLPKEFSSESSTRGSLITDDNWEVSSDSLLLQEVIGEGAFGVVKRGTMAPEGKEVAVKMLKQYPSVEEYRSFLGEMELMKSVGAHPHVVSLLGCCSGRRPMIVVEYCSRGDLLSYLRCAWDVMVSKRNAKYYNNNIEFSTEYRNDLFKSNSQKDSNSKMVVNKMYDLQGVCDTELTPKDLLSFCRQIAKGMEFLSSNRVVHRDLAARNVLVAADKTLKIADFGLSRDIYQENQYKQRGTGKLPIKWMALESLTHRIYTTQSDVWSFGVVIWEVMTVGGSPYPNVHASKVSRLLRDGYRMPRPYNCSEQLYEIMASCWQARPYDRPTFIELHIQLDRLLNHACCDDYLSLEIGADDAPTPKPTRRLGFIPRSTKKHRSHRDMYERPWKPMQSNHYTSPPNAQSRHQKLDPVII